MQRDSNDIRKELNSLRIELWLDEKHWRVRANEYDWEELLSVIRAEDDQYSKIKQL